MFAIPLLGKKWKILRGFWASVPQLAAGVDRLRDIFDGNLYREFHVEELSLFTDPHDIALHLSLNGMQLTNMKNYEITPVILTFLRMSDTK